MEHFSLDNIDPSDERASELVTTSYIFPELMLSSPYSASISLPVTPINGVYAVFGDGESGDNADNIDLDGRQKVEGGDEDPKQAIREDNGIAYDEDTLTLLKHLPPIQLAFTLSEGYPTDCPPDVELKSSWIPKYATKRLKSEIHHIWEDTRDHIVYAMIDHVIQSSEDTFQAGAISVKGSQPRRIVEFPTSLRDEMVAFDKKARREEFEKGTYTCGVCLEPKKGNVCHSLFPCHHVFCNPCLQDFYTSCIEEGNVSAVKCLDTACILNKKKKEPPPQPLPNHNEDNAAPEHLDPPPPSVQPTLPPGELVDIGLSSELITRYRRLKRKAALDADPNTIYCPRKWCQAPSRGSIEEMDRKIGTKGFYLNETHMHPESELEVIPEIAAPNEKNPEKFHDKNGYEKDRMGICSECGLAFCNLCLKGWHGYFQVCIPKDAPLSEEEIASEEYLKCHATKCPYCLSWCTKSHGCNHMSCKCGTHFCFLCGAYLVPSNPYAHFSAKGTPCYMRLWEGEEGDGEDISEDDALEEELILDMGDDE